LIVRGEERNDMTILVIPRADIEEALALYPSDFAEEVAAIAAQCTKTTDLVESDLVRLGGEETTILVNRRGRGGVEITFNDPDRGRVPRLPTVGVVTYIYSDSAKEITHVRIGPRDEDSHCFQSEDGEVWNNAQFDAMIDKIDKMLEGEQHAFDRDGAIAEINRALPLLDDADLAAVLDQARKILR
jgi:hypothetical protein